MQTSRYLISTTRETPADAVIASHQLMLKAGLIRRLAAGLYTWKPLGLRVLQRVEAIIREEMDRSGALEVSMPVVQPAELWHESGRWENMGAELQRLTDRHGRDFCLGPTHEEVITDLVRNELSSYKELPMNLYQIQTKFRDERRPRFGVMRAREFIMKDAYSFHVDQDSLDETYQLMHDTYSRIFTRLGLTFRAVEADSGNIGGNRSHEFHVLASSGEDEIVFSDQSQYAANMEMATALPPTASRPAPTQPLESVQTPRIKTIDSLCEFMNVKPEQTIKTLLVQGEDEPIIALVLRGDHQLNEIKASKLPGVAEPLSMADDETIRAAIDCPAGFIGPVGLTVPVIVDRDAAVLADFVCGANREDTHLRGANWERDCHYTSVADLRKVVEGDVSPDGQGSLSIKRGIEVGHIFQLGNTYSSALKASVLNDAGKSVILEMGCYGIGVSRVVAACIEQSHDDRGIIWPDNIAPFQVAIIPLNAHRSPDVLELAQRLYTELQEQGLTVLLDDRDRKTSPGVKFADMDLIGIPHRLVVSDRLLESGEVEYKTRSAELTENLPLISAVDTLLARINRD